MTYGVIFLKSEAVQTHFKRSRNIWGVKLQHYTVRFVNHNNSIDGYQFSTLSPSTLASFRKLTTTFGSTSGEFEVKICA